jgi:hypothetical protein
VKKAIDYGEQRRVELQRGGKLLKNPAHVTELPNTIAMVRTCLTFSLCFSELFSTLTNATVRASVKQKELTAQNSARAVLRFINRLKIETT